MIYKKLLVDEYSDLFDVDGMEYMELPSVYSKVREYTLQIIKGAPEHFQEGNLLEQQTSELIKNAIKHGNHKDPSKIVKVWYSFKKRVRFVIEDEGDGFKLLEEWNKWFKERQIALNEQDFDRFLDLASYRGPASEDEDGGNSLIAAIDYWNGGIIYNEKKNKVGVIRWYSNYMN